MGFREDLFEFATRPIVIALVAIAVGWMFVAWWWNRVGRHRIRGTLTVRREWVVRRGRELIHATPSEDEAMVLFVDIVRGGGAPPRA